MIEKVSSNVKVKENALLVSQLHSQGLITFPFFAWAMQRAGNEEGRHAEGRQ